ncbi:hypothetical protein FHG87_015935 [Trinorchestia longiramus]|nr:hypothetical protein FHG87_015935 [Trinorchestia longiramus]
MQRWGLGPRHLVLKCSKYEHERESLMDVVHKQCGENKWNARINSKGLLILMVVVPGWGCHCYVLTSIRR